MIKTLILSAASAVLLESKPDACPDCPNVALPVAPVCIVGDCLCPHVQDAGIVKPVDTIGVLEFSSAQCSVLGLAAESQISDIHVDSYDVANLCGLLQTVQHECGNLNVEKDWKVNGDITVCEKTESCGTDGSCRVLKGR